MANKVELGIEANTDALDRVIEKLERIGKLWEGLPPDLRNLIMLFAEVKYINNNVTLDLLEEDDDKHEPVWDDGLF